MSLYTLADHEAAVRQVSEDVTCFHAAKIPFRINHGSTNSTRARDPKVPQLNIEHLRHVISIDGDSQIAWVEPNVALDGLLAETLKIGLMPSVVVCS